MRYKLNKHFSYEFMASLASFKSTESINVKKDDKAFHALGQAFVGIDKSLLYKHAVCLLCQSDIKKMHKTEKRKQMWGKGNNNIA